MVQTFRRSKKCLGPARNQTPECPAHSFVNIVNAIPPPTLLSTENEREANLFVSRYQIFMQFSDDASAFFSACEFYRIVPAVIRW